MTDHPAIFSGQMVQALLEGLKTQTRRTLYVQRKYTGVRTCGATHHTLYPPPRLSMNDPMNVHWTLSPWAKVVPGDRLWVRERLGAHKVQGNWTDASLDLRVSYLADGSIDKWARPWPRRWQNHDVPSIHCPREFSRLTLVVTETRIERLNDISKADAQAEGCGLYVPGHGFVTKGDLAEGYSNFLAPRLGFEAIWTELNGPDAWAANPWVVALSFQVKKCNIDAREAA